MFRQLRVLFPGTCTPAWTIWKTSVRKRANWTSRAGCTRLLHGWLLVHIPLSYALLFLGACHAVMAVRF